MREDTHQGAVNGYGEDTHQGAVYFKSYPPQVRVSTQLLSLQLDEIVHPTLIIHGTDDLIWHFKHSGVLLNKIHNSKIIELEGTGHEIHPEDWNTIIDGITRHINES